MPYHVAKTSKCPDAKPWGCIKNSDGKVMGCHPTKADAEKQMAALYANEPKEQKSMAKVDNSSWDASKAWSNGANSDSPATFYKGICAGEKNIGDADTQAHWALPHHYHPGDPPNAAGVRNGLSRLPQAQGLKNKQAAQSHLDGHMSVINAEKKAATGRATRAEIVAARKAQRAHGEFPGGPLRTKSFPGKLQVRMVDKGGKQFYHIDGFATVFERRYPMWDMFGEYKEVVDYSALSKSLAGNPDVAWLVNHRGVTMARTTNGTLELAVRTTDDGFQGLHTDAYLNPDRQDVRDIVSAIVDELVDEMSFAFMLNDGEWNEDYTEFRIKEADINRGDVSAVNYGANPYTSIQARTSEILADLGRLPAVALSRARQIVTSRTVRSAAESLSERSSERYQRAADHLERIIGESGRSERADADEDPQKLLASLDAVLDEASDLGGDVDRTSVSPEVAQVLDLVTAAESIVDNLMDLMGVFDPDDDDSGERSQSKPEVKLDKSDMVHIPGGKSLSLWRSRLENLKNGKIVLRLSGHGLPRNGHSHSPSQSLKQQSYCKGP